MAEEKNSDIEDIQVQNTQQMKYLEESLIWAKNSVKEINDTIKKSSIRIIGIPEGEERETRLQEVLKEIVEENFPNLGDIKASKIQQGKRTLSRFDLKRPLPRHIVIKLPSNKCKERILKQARKQGTRTFRGKPIRIISDFSEETLQVRQ